MAICAHSFAGAALAPTRPFRSPAAPRGRRLGLQVSALRRQDSNRDPYDLLGVARGASEDEIKRAHRKLVKQHHPDVRSGDPMAHARFLSIQEAYELLVGKRQGKEVDETRPGGGRGGWSFHDWYWSFSMRRRSKSASGGAFTGAAGGAAPPGSAEHWRTQMAGLRSKAAAKRSQRPRRQAHAADSGASAAAASGPAASSAAREQVWRSMTKNAKNADKAAAEEAGAAAQALGSASWEAAHAAKGAGPPPAAPPPPSPRHAAAAAAQQADAAQQGRQQPGVEAASTPAAAPDAEPSSAVAPASPSVHHLRLRQLAEAAAAAVRGLQPGRHLRRHLSLQQLAAMLGGSAAEQDSAAGNAVPADQQLHHKFEATRLRRQQQQQQHAAAAPPHAEHAAAQHAAAAEQAAEGEAPSAAPGAAQHAFRNADHSRKFANRDEVEGRLSSQLSGLKRRAAMKQEEVRTYG